MKSIIYLAIALIIASLTVSTINGQLAHCLLRGTSYAKGLKGSVYLTQSDDGTTYVAWSLDQSTVPTALQGKTLGFHIHQYGYIADATASGTHFNPLGKNHALPSDNTTDMHVGDLGNIDLSKGYSGVITSTLPQFNGTISIIGRAIRLHMSADLGKIAQPTGNASNPAANCVIGIANNAANTMTYSDQYSDNFGAAVFQKTGSATTNVTGRVLFSYASGMTRVYGKICGLPASTTHGLHIHAYGEIDLTDGLRTGGHFNPFNKTHGYPGSTERHVGDLGNVTADSNGVATFDFSVDLIEMTGVRNIIGRGLVLHTSRDDGTSTSATGNAGSRIAVAVIGIPPSTATLSFPVDACVDPAPAADVVTPTTSTVTPKASAKTSKAVSGSSVASFSMLLIALISFIASLL